MIGFLFIILKNNLSLILPKNKLFAKKQRPKIFMRSFRLMPLSTPLSTGFLFMQTTVNVHEFWTLAGGCFDVPLLDPLVLVPAPQMAPAPPLRPAPPRTPAPLALLGPDPPHPGAPAPPPSGISPPKEPVSPLRPAHRQKMSCGKLK